MSLSDTLPTPTEHEFRLRQTHGIMQLLREWQVSASDQLSLLSLPEGTRARTIRQYWKDTPLPDTPEVNTRIKKIRHIDSALHTTYPRNSRMGTVWLNNPHRRLNNATPLAYMIEHGDKGVEVVLTQLDCNYAWDKSGSSS